MAIRSDLQNKAAKIGDTMTPKVPPSNQYGESARLMRGLKDVPAGKSPTTAPQEGKPKPMPGRVVDLLGPTQRPMEPITNGADFGPGMSALQAGVLHAPHRMTQSSSCRTLLASTRTAALPTCSTSMGLNVLVQKPRPKFAS